MCWRQRCSPTRRHTHVWRRWHPATVWRHPATDHRHVHAVVHRRRAIRWLPGWLPCGATAAAARARTYRPGGRHGGLEAASLHLVLVGDVSSWVAPEDVIVDHLADLAAHFVRELLPISRDLHRLVLVPGIGDIGHIPEVEVIKAEPAHVEHTAITLEDVCPPAAADFGLHLSVALKSTTAVY